ncbi:MAG: hypothetical protein CM15mV14_0640 [uncultured marine virus]|nr:MAG: hypothetical protein CM15mV14_0640 [uncultured marine virus]
MKVINRMQKCTTEIAIAKKKKQEDDMVLRKTKSIVRTEVDEISKVKDKEEEVKVRFGKR